MDELVKAGVLGIIQGLTEWLPISSTGHLRLTERFLGLRVTLLFEVILHAGTLAAVITFFRKEIWKILFATAHFRFKNEYGRLMPLLVVGVTPTFLIGLIFGRLIDETFQEVVPIAIAWVICGLLMYSSKWRRDGNRTIGYVTAMVLGVVQGVALIPGFSRSGLTISASFLLGIKREKAFEFSFLLSIPAILGALVFSAYKGWGRLSAETPGISAVFTGFTGAMLIGYFALRLLRKSITREKFHYFAHYCMLLGASLIILSCLFQAL